MEIDISSDHHGRELFDRGILCVDCPDVFPLTENTAAVSNFHDFIQLVRDKENALAFCGKILHDLHQL